jgi:signal peptidase I
MEPRTLPKDTFFMMGDNRDKSHDSRYFGPVSREKLIGRPLFVYWSFDGTYPLRDATAREWAEHFASVAVHFFTQTRWDRTGTVLR